MTSEIVKKNEKIKVGMFLSILGVLVFMLSSFLAYFYNTEAQQILLGDSVSFSYVAIALFTSIASLIIGSKAILSTYREIMGLSK